ncbi:hypothetical protein CANCADRAFT_15349, partial [Tortispora caseinolytica NRRL Y-17796]
LEKFDDGGSKKTRFTPVLDEVYDNIKKYDPCVVLTRLGGFYELYFDQAAKYGPLLNLKVSSRPTTAGLVPMAGFPFMHLQRYLAILVNKLNCHVAISEEFPPTPGSTTKNLYERRICRVITPGTLLDESFLDPMSSNYLLSVVPTPHQRASKNAKIGLAWIDLSTGDFFSQLTTPSLLSSDITRISPKEVLLPSLDDFPLPKRTAKPNSVPKALHEVYNSRKSKSYSVAFSPLQSPLTHSDFIDQWQTSFISELRHDAIEEFDEIQLAACSKVLEYVNYCVPDGTTRALPPVNFTHSSMLLLDSNSVSNLEIKKTLADGSTVGSLLQTIRRTSTQSGARRLLEWLLSPTTDIEEITFRQDLVEVLVTEDGQWLRNSIIARLRKIDDLRRLSHRFSIGRGSPDGMLALARSIHHISETEKLIREHTSGLKNQSLRKLVAKLNLSGPLALADEIQRTIDEVNLSIQHEMERQREQSAYEEISQEGATKHTKIITESPIFEAPEEKRWMGVDTEPWIILPHATHELEMLRSRYSDLIEEIRSLEHDLRDHIEINNTELRWSANYGYIVHFGSISASRRLLLDEHPPKLLTSTKSSAAFSWKPWVDLGNELGSIRLRIREEEKKILRRLKALILENYQQLQETSAIIDRIDIACSFAELAEEANLVRPVLTNDQKIEIKGGRHITVEAGLMERASGSFVPNDCYLKSPKTNHERVWVITGPNMAGKSTFLRQNVIIAILAQIGSYVPAESATIGIVDRIFSRIGAHDNLYRDQSTFMVEMIETAAILNNATPSSLVIMDEVGRGTSPDEGEAIAFGCLNHLYSVNKSRVLFATHFHNLAQHSATIGKIGVYCTGINDVDGEFWYDHKIRPGIAGYSHALKVAEMAGVPARALKFAKDVLEVKARSKQEAEEPVLAYASA